MGVYMELEQPPMAQQDPQGGLLGHLYVVQIDFNRHFSIEVIITILESGCFEMGQVMEKGNFNDDFELGFSLFLKKKKINKNFQVFWELLEN